MGGRVSLLQMCVEMIERGEWLSFCEHKASFVDLALNPLAGTLAHL
jgi:hypothetical protein